LDGRALTPRERRALDGIAEQLAADRRLRRSLAGGGPRPGRLRVVAAAVMITCITASLVVVGVLARSYPPLIALMAAFGVLGGLGLVVWAARDSR
jgi:Flp pilus assembly protein TadB